MKAVFSTLFLLLVVCTTVVMASDPPDVVLSLSAYSAYNPEYPVVNNQCSITWGESYDQYYTDSYGNFSVGYYEPLQEMPDYWISKVSESEHWYWCIPDAEEEGQVISNISCKHHNHSFTYYP